MRINRLELDDFRGIEHLDITMPDGNLLVLLGENGAGKSSVLAGVCYGLLGPILPSSGHKSVWNVRRAAPSNRATLAAHVPSGATTVHITRRKALEEVNGAADFGADVLWDDESAELFLAGYGAGRRTESAHHYDPDLRNRSSGRRLQRVGSLLEPSFSLVPLDSWLPHADIIRHAEVSGILEAATQGKLRLTQKRTDDGLLLFEFDGDELPMRALSDGYRAHVGWLSDLLFHLHEAAGTQQSLMSLTGTVLVDEIDLHLHPRWQRQVLHSLTKALCNLQFIVTTHSPLVLGGVDSETVRVLREREGTLVADKPGIQTYGMSPDQLLLSDLFQLESTRAPQFLDRLN